MPEYLVQDGPYCAAHLTAHLTEMSERGWWLDKIQVHGFFKKTVFMVFARIPKIPEGIGACIPKQDDYPLDTSFVSGFAESESHKTIGDFLKHEDEIKEEQTVPAVPAKPKATRSHKAPKHQG